MSFNTGSLDVKCFLHYIHSGTVASRRAIVSVLIKKSQHRASELFTTGCTLNEDQVWRSLDKEQVQRVLDASLPMMYYETDPCILQLFFLLFRDGNVSVGFLNGESLLQALLKTFSGLSVFTKAIPCPDTAFPTAF